MNKQQLIENLTNAKLTRKNKRIQYRNARRTYRKAKRALKLYKQSERNMITVQKQTEFVNDMLEEELAKSDD